MRSPVIAGLLLFASVFATAAPTKSSGMKCSAFEVGGKTMLSIRLPKNHGGNFAIKNPKGEFYFIAFDQPDKKRAPQPIFSEAMFKELKTLKIKIADAKGCNWSKRGEGKGPIFIEKGDYQVVVASTLETEDPVLDGWCDLHYTP